MRKCSIECGFCNRADLLCAPLLPPLQWPTMSPELWFPSGKERVFVLCPPHSGEPPCLHTASAGSLLVRYCLLRANLRVWSFSEEWIQFCNILADQWRALVTTVMNLREDIKDKNVCIFWLIQASPVGLGHVNAVPFCSVGHGGTRSQWFKQAKGLPA
jgi:hypothetical protein